ncbi:MAG TPA: hypothetical protein VMT18_15905 [Planctomycetota bacterium]|nr:hypothetical protein [Planctomycetota bacterium]
MHRFARRGLALALGTGLGLVLAAGLLPAGVLLGWPVTGFDGYLGSHPALEAMAASRADEIENELLRLDDHRWAGRYTSPALFPEELLLAPDGGFTIYVNSGCGNCTGFEAMGRVRELAPDRLLLEPEEAHWARYMRSNDPQVLHLFEWNGRRMAVLESQVEDFCAALTARASMPSSYIRRDADHVHEREEPCPPGRPTLPEPLRALAPEQPIEGAIVGLAEEPPPPDDDGAVNALFRLDRGSDHGLAVGMRLRIAGVKSAVRVETVERKSATLRHWTGGRYNPPLEEFLGSAVRTLHPVEPVAGE